MTEEMYVTRLQLRDAGADDEWFRTHMRGRGKLALSRVLVSAPKYFSIHVYVAKYTGNVVYTEGTKIWFVEGEFHRDDGPAVIMSSGVEKWYRHGHLHREGGPAIFRPGHSSRWYIDGELHRTDGPAIERADGWREWWFHGRRHRDDGPAIVWSDGTRRFYRHGEFYANESAWRAAR